MRTMIANWLYNTIDFICLHTARWLTSNLIALAFWIDGLVLRLGMWAVKGQTNLALIELDDLQSPEEFRQEYEADWPEERVDDPRYE